MVSDTGFSEPRRDETGVDFPVFPDETSWLRYHFSRNVPDENCLNGLEKSQNSRLFLKSGTEQSIPQEMYHPLPNFEKSLEFLVLPFGLKLSVNRIMIPWFLIWEETS